MSLVTMDRIAGMNCHYRFYTLEDFFCRIAAQWYHACGIVELRKPFSAGRKQLAGYKRSKATGSAVRHNDHLPDTGTKQPQTL